MPWEERKTMSLRIEFVAEAMAGETSFAALCRKYNISRKTGYKWIQRMKEDGDLSDRSRAPHTVVNRTPAEQEALILDCRAEHPAWGPRKIERYLQNRGCTDIPCKSTIANILLRNECIDPEESEKHTPWIRFEKSFPNDLWQMDFKGEFNMLNQELCYPLTVTDDNSRMNLCLKAMPNVKYTGFKPVFSRVLSEYGRPYEILCDHGKPWSDSKNGITEFDLWMMQLDILPIHGRIKHPQTQGKAERFHRTLKTELLRYRPMRDLTDAQACFDKWRWEYNNERPHEALNMKCPANCYKESKRRMIDTLTEPEYDTGEKLRKVNYKGYVSVNRKRYYLSEILAGKLLSMREASEDMIVLSYGHFDIAKIDLEEGCLKRHIFRKHKV